MAISKLDIVTLASFSKDFVAVNTSAYTSRKLNTGTATTLDGNGIGITAGTSAVWIFHFGGSNNQRAVAEIKYLSPTAAGAEQIGVLLCCQGFDATADQSYYYYRVRNQNAEILRVDGGTFSSVLASDTFPLPQGTLVTIDASRVGTTLSASFTASGVTTRNLSATDPGTPLVKGSPAFRGLSTALACKSFAAYQLVGG